MKKWLISILTTAVVLMLCTAAAMAAPQTVVLDEFGFRVDIPEEYLVYTRDIAEDDPKLSYIGFTKDDLISLFESSNIYINGVPDPVADEIIIAVTDVSLADFDGISEGLMESLADAFVEEYTAAGINVINCEIVAHLQTKYIRFCYQNTANSVYGVQYYTVKNGHAIFITLNSYLETLNDQQEATIKAVADSAVYTRTAAETVAVETEPFFYQHADTGVSFIVPANWLQQEVSPDKKYVKAEFIESTDRACTIMYNFADVWEQLSALEKLYCSRSDFNNSIYTLADVGEMLGVPESEVSMVEYNGIQYFCGVMSRTVSQDGLNIPVTMTTLVHFRNGMYYMMQFSGDETHPLYGDFEKLLSSVQIP